MSATPHTSDPSDVRHATAAPRLVEVPWRRLLAIEGRGRPGGEAFQAAIKALYSIAYGARFALRRRGVEGGRIGSLEGFFSLSMGEAGDEPEWELFLPAADAVDADLVEEVRAHASRAAADAPLDHVRLVEYREGLCVEVLHVGPYDAERATIERLHRFALEQGFELRGRHHEIYLSDPRRTPPERLKTVIRQPVLERSA
jgi:hypothetical protein